MALESGWSRGVLTHYFDNKDALLEASLRHGMRTIAANLAAAAEAPRCDGPGAGARGGAAPRRTPAGVLPGTSASWPRRSSASTSRATSASTTPPGGTRSPRWCAGVQGHIDAAVEPHPPPARWPR
ncbi:MAG: TetR/AcrR family transcriptional regulator [Acidimicrobiales bacterium]